MAAASCSSMEELGFSEGEIKGFKARGDEADMLLGETTMPGERGVKGRSAAGDTRAAIPGSNEAMSGLP